MHVYNLEDAQIILRTTDTIRKVYVELSSECNFACKMCFRHSFSTPVGSMSDAILENVQVEIATLPHIQEVVLGGLGEPFLHPQIGRMISFLKRREISVILTTNGALLESHIDLLLEQEVDKLVISFETGDIGHSNEYYVFDIIKKIAQQKEALQKISPSIAIFMVLTKENVSSLPHIAKRLRQSGVREVLLSNLLPANETQQNLILYPQPEPEEVTTFKAELFRNILLDKIRCKVPFFEAQTERFCDFVDAHALVIRWDGEVAPCYRLLHTRDEIVLEKTKKVKACSFGNITREHLLDIWNSREYAWFRYTVRNSRYPSCLDCSLREGCEFIESTEADCWGNEHSCADCLWARRFVRCP
jgi:tungsten cofactor oxidoreducase radical SAM maturase